MRWTTLPALPLRRAPMTCRRIHGGERRLCSFRTGRGTTGQGRAKSGVRVESSRIDSTQQFGSCPRTWVAPEAYVFLTLSVTHTTHPECPVIGFSKGPTTGPRRTSALSLMAPPLRPTLPTPSLPCFSMVARLDVLFIRRSALGRAFPSLVARLSLRGLRHTGPGPLSMTLPPALTCPVPRAVVPAGDGIDSRTGGGLAEAISCVLWGNSSKAEDLRARSQKQTRALCQLSLPPPPAAAAAYGWDVRCKDLSTVARLALVGVADWRLQAKTAERWRCLWRLLRFFLPS